ETASRRDARPDRRAEIRRHRRGPRHLGRRREVTRFPRRAYRKNKTGKGRNPTMNEEQLLKAALPPVKDLEPRRDLCPAMRRKIDEETIRVPIWDWALIAAVLAWIAIFPKGALALLYHL